MARTDARSTHGLEEALWRMRAFADLGADILFMEAPRSEAEMAAFCAAVPGPKLANMLEEGLTPVLPPQRLAELGYKIAAYPLTLLSCAVQAMIEALEALKQGQSPERRLPFARLKTLLGFEEYDRQLNGYRLPAASTPSGTE